MITPPSAAPTPAWLGPYLPAFDDLLRVVELSAGFVLMPLEVPGPDLARAFGAWLTAQGHPALVIEPAGDDGWNELAATLRKTRTEAGGVVMVVGGRELPAGFDRGARNVNELRDTIVAQLGCVLFWCGPASFLDATGERAPDFWSIRAVDRRLEPASAAPPPPPAAAPMSARPALDLLEEAKTQGDRRSVGMLAARRADGLLAEGKLDEAEALLDETLPVVSVREPALQGELLLLQAEAARRRGKTGEAMKRLTALRALGPASALVCRGHLAMGGVLEGDGALEAASHEYEEALDAARLAGDRSLEAMASARLGAVGVKRGRDVESALRRIERGVDIAGGDGTLEALTTALLAEATAHLHDRGRALHLLDEARALARRAEGAPTVVVGGELEQAFRAAEDALGTAEGPVEAGARLASSIDDDPRTAGPVELMSSKSPASVRLGAPVERSRLQIAALLAVVLVTVVVGRAWLAPRPGVPVNGDGADAGASVSVAPPRPSPPDAGGVDAAPVPSSSAVPAVTGSPDASTSAGPIPVPHPWETAWCYLIQAAGGAETRCFDALASCEVSAHSARAASRTLVTQCTQKRIQEAPFSP